MASDLKPVVLARYVVGKIIDSVAGLCATMNWVISCLDNVKARYGVKVSGLESGTPVIESDLEGVNGVKVENFLGAPTKISANLLAGDGVRLEKQSTGEIKISAKGGVTIQTDSGSWPSVGAVFLKSGSQSNVKFSVSTSADDDSGFVTATVAVDVYWLK